MTPDEVNENLPTVLLTHQARGLVFCDRLPAYATPDEIFFLSLRSVTFGDALIRRLQALPNSGISGQGWKAICYPPRLWSLTLANVAGKSRVSRVAFFFDVLPPVFVPIAEIIHNGATPETIMQWLLNFRKKHP